MNDASDSDVDVTEPRPAVGLFQSLSALLANLITLAQTRFELLTTELQEEIHRAAGLLLWMLMALALTGIGLFMAGLTIIVAFWETHRLPAAVLVTISFFVLAGACVVRLRARLREKPRLLDATRTELEKDKEQLQARI
jgi:uncharacterized membrane protein YqjE